LLFSFDTLLLAADAEKGWDEDFADHLHDSDAAQIEDEFLEENGVVFIRAKKDFQAVAFTPDGQFLLTACGDKTVRFWEGDTLEAVQGFDWKIGDVESLAVASDGMRAAAGGSKGQIVVWDIDI